MPCTNNYTIASPISKKIDSTEEQGGIGRTKFIYGQKFVGEMIHFQRNFWGKCLRDSTLKENIGLNHIIFHNNQFYN